MTSIDPDHDADIDALRGPVVDGAARAERAVLAPQDPGGLSIAERVAFAVRIARLGDNAALADHYMDRLLDLDPPVALIDVASGLEPRNARLGILVDHVDLLTCRPERVRAEHIQTLRAGGISDADIVRLSELIAFANYQLRAKLGMSLLVGVA